MGTPTPTTTPVVDIAASSWVGVFIWLVHKLGLGCRLTEKKLKGNVMAEDIKSQNLKGSGLAEIIPSHLYIYVSPMSTSEEGLNEMRRRLSLGKGCCCNTSRYEW